MARFDLPAIFGSGIGSEIGSQITGDNPKRTTRSESPSQFSLSSYGLSEALHKTSAFNSPANVINLLGSLVSTAIVSFDDFLRDIPGLGGLLGDELTEAGQTINPDGGWEEGLANYVDEKTDGINGSVAPGAYGGIGGGQAGAVVQIALEEVGESESPAGSNRVKYTEWWGNDTLWQGIFVSWVLNRAGFTRPSSQSTTYFASSRTGVELFKEAGAWTDEESGVNPAPGDIIFFGERGQANHVGIVVGVEGNGTIITVEGNTSSRNYETNGGSVVRKTYGTNSRNRILGWGTPTYQSTGVAPGPDGELGTGDDITYAPVAPTTGGSTSGSNAPGPLTWLAGDLQRAGLTVQTIPGWESKSTRDASSYNPFVMVVHMTAGKGYSSDFPSRDTVVNGRSDVAGPLYNVVIGRTSGDAYIVAAGSTNNAGSGSYKGATTNSHTIGLSLENDNLGEVVSTQAYRGLVRAAAAISLRYGIPIDNICGHREWAPNRKSDPVGIEMSVFRNDVLQRRGELARAGFGPPAAGTGTGSGGGGGAAGATGFIWPMVGRVSSEFGPRTAPTAGASTDHKGIDISGPSGRSVVASKAGTVVTSTFSNTAGNFVVLDHGGGYKTRYLHHISNSVSVGQQVEQGQEVGKCGETGTATGPHTHFEIKVNDVAVNPRQHIPGEPTPG